jgi:phenylalanyl-tRNA synthetase beta chain
MRISLNWLRDYVALTLPAHELARRLTLSTMEVEDIKPAFELAGLLVGQAFDVAPIAGSDHLRTARVETGSDSFNVVCGAPNLAEGQKIAFAPPGAQVLDARSHEKKTLKPAKIMGVESNGMICSERELGLSEEHTGILVLSEDAPLGAPLSDLIGDTVLTATGWAHRADLLSMLGVAREVAALTAQQVNEPPLEYPETLGPTADVFAVDVQAPDLCARFVAGVVEGVKIGPSPAWLQERLNAADIRPINNVVDITNYVMLEIGQPLHAYDFERVRGKRLTVRRAISGERLITLDGIDRVLTPDMLLICDAEGPTGLAGVMGGQLSEIAEDTVNVLLEGATWSASNIRRTSTLLGLRSEASSRFEKNVPAALAEQGVRRAMRLLVELAGGQARGPLVDHYPAPQPAKYVELPSARLTQVLGIDVGPEEVTPTLSALGFAVEQRDGGYGISVPYWRTDVSIPDDVVEEVIRILGFERLPATMIRGRLPEPIPQPQRDLREKVRDLLVAAGTQEVITYSAVSEPLLLRVMTREDLLQISPLRILNPVSNEHEYMRPTPRASMLETLRGNLRLGRPSLSLFETATVYFPREVRADLPEEREVLAGALSGRRADRWGRPSTETLDFYDAKGVVELLSERLGVPFSFAPSVDPLFVPGRAASITAAGRTLGVVGAVHPEVLQRFDIGAAAYYYELDLTVLLPLTGAVHRASSVVRLPAVHLDLGIVVDRDMPSGEIAAQIGRSKLVASVDVIDEYIGEQVPRGKKGLTFSVAYQSAERTLTADEAAREQDRLLGGLRKRFGAELRG